LVKFIFHLNLEEIKAIVMVYIPTKRQPNVTEELNDLFITMIKLARTFESRLYSTTGTYSF